MKRAILILVITLLLFVAILITGNRRNPPQYFDPTKDTLVPLDNGRIPDTLNNNKNK